MICYRDMTFCRGCGCAKFNVCFRALTEKVKERAVKFGLPIAECEEPKKMPCYTKVKGEG